MPVCLLRSRAMGLTDLFRPKHRHSDVRVRTAAVRELTETGYVWKLPAGPNAHMVYTATFDGNSWSQIGEYTPASGTPMKTFEMSLTRVGETAWPAGNPVSPAAE